MVDFLPFQSTQYNSALNLNRVIAPPYDQISLQMQEDLYKRDPHNFVRLILGKTFDADSEKENRYTRAAADLEAWRKEGILIEEQTPAFYLYEQNFGIQGGASYTRLGIVGLLRLEPLGKGVLPHEQTFSKPKEDRLNLMKACKANFEHVFFIYDDPRHFIREISTKIRLTRPLAACRDDQGTSHTVWSIQEAETMANVSAFFKPKTLLIADGHHRYETSLEYQRQMKEIWCDSTSDQAPFNYRLATLVALQDPGLLILPTHRVLRDLSADQMTQLESALPTYFNIESVSDLSALQDWMRKTTHALGFINSNDVRLLTLKDSFDVKKEFSEFASPLQELDVILLQKLVFDRILNLPHDQLDRYVTFVRWPEDALSAIRSGSHHAAFLLTGVKPTQVRDVAETGEKMPHKSTDFYPKLWSGLLFYKMNM